MAKPIEQNASIYLIVAAFCDVHVLPGRECGLMAASVTLMSIKAPFIDEHMLVAITARAADHLTSESSLKPPHIDVTVPYTR